MVRYIIFIFTFLYCYQFGAGFDCVKIPSFAYASYNHGANNDTNTKVEKNLSSIPSKSLHRVVVVGDSLGDGIWMGLYDAFRRDLKVKIIRHSQVSTGFVSKDFFDWNREIVEIVKEKKPDALVMLFGTNDIRPMRTAEGYHAFFSSSWVRHYRERLSKFLQYISKQNIPSYWIGLPNMRKKKMSESAAKLNKIMRSEAYKVGVTFIETWKDFSDKNGRYYSYGPDLNGKIRRLRANDGVHFTRIGYRKLAYGVEKALRKQLGQ